MSAEHAIPALQETWCDASGLPIRVHIWNPHHELSPLVFLNGVCCSLEMVAPLARQFRSRPFIAIETPGAGLTPETEYPLSPTQLARIIAQVTAEIGLKRFSLMGLSLGGALAQQVAAQYRGQIDKLILAATCSGYTMTPADWTETNLWRSLNPFAAVTDDLLSDLANAHINGVALTNIPSLMKQFASFAGWSSLGLLPMIDAPTLVLAGSRDRIVPASNALQLSAFLRHGQHRILPDAGHLFPFTEPERTASHVERFLTQQDA